MGSDKGTGDIKLMGIAGAIFIAIFFMIDDRYREFTEKEKAIPQYVPKDLNYSYNNPNIRLAPDSMQEEVYQVRRQRSRLDDKSVIMDYQDVTFELEQIMEELEDPMDQDELDEYINN